MIIELQDAETTFIHQVCDVKVERGLRKVKVGCGTPIEPDDPDVPPYEWTAWPCDVTCPDCRRRVGQE